VIPMSPTVIMTEAEAAKIAAQAQYTKICPDLIKKAVPLANLICDDTKIMQALGATISGEVPEKLKALGLTNFSTKAELMDALISAGRIRISDPQGSGSVRLDNAPTSDPNQAPAMYSPGEFASGWTQSSIADSFTNAANNIFSQNPVTPEQAIPDLFNQAANNIFSNYPAQVDLTPGFNLGISDGSLWNSLSSSAQTFTQTLPQLFPPASSTQSTKQNGSMTAGMVILGAALIYALVKKK
jgi:hypothetical protein